MSTPFVGPSRSSSRTERQERVDVPGIATGSFSSEEPKDLNVYPGGRARRCSHRPLRLAGCEEPYESSPILIKPSAARCRFARAPSGDYCLPRGCGMLGGCIVGPKYQRPAVAVAPAYKELGNGQPAEPKRHATVRGQWWEVFQDPQLNHLERRVDLAEIRRSPRRQRTMKRRARLCGRLAHNIFPR